MKLPRVIAAIQALFEAFVLAEILWYYLTNGEQTLHGWVQGMARRTVHEIRLAHVARKVLREIRDLPEQEK